MHQSVVLGQLLRLSRVARLSWGLATPEYDRLVVVAARSKNVDFRFGRPFPFPFPFPCFPCSCPGWLDEVCAMQQPMTTQTTMTAKSTIDPTVTPTTIPATLARERYKKELCNTFCHDSYWLSQTYTVHYQTCMNNIP